jgi:Acyl-protein synthetase, LuxE
MRSELIHKIFAATETVSEEIVLEVFRYQYDQNELYRRFCEAVGKGPGTVQRLADLPFLPIRFFKSHLVITGSFSPDNWFESSGTTGTASSRHYFPSLELYRKSFLRGFSKFYGDPKGWCILGLLPAYLERERSSLVVMVNELIALSGHPQSGFYLYDFEKLKTTLRTLEQRGTKVLLIGVTFALLDFAASSPLPLKHTTIMETGGMKGRRKEITRAELHQTLGAAFGHPPVHSEYGMTELLSQAYAGDNGFFYCAPQLRILLREEDDPFAIFSPVGLNPTGETRRVRQGAINVIDLANLDSCCFLATDDLGRMHPNGGFEVLGRIDNSDIRGCSQLTV